MTKTNGKTVCDFGLLLLRVGIGTMSMYHGFPKLLAGPQVWGGVGQAMGVLGITFAPQFWGFMAAFAEFFGGIALISGFLMRPFCALLAFTMSVASLMHLNKGDGLQIASHAVELGVLYLSLIFIGPGAYSVDEGMRKEGGSCCCR